jgi:hypothetical protein
MLLPEQRRVLESSVTFDAIKGKSIMDELGSL